MAVILTVSETLGGAEVADSLAGAGTGVDLGQVVNGQYSPIIDQTLNTGAQVLYLRHNAVVDPITNLKIYLDSYSRTGFTYGGASTASSDYNSLKAEGSASDVTASAKNNSNGLAGGIWMEQQYDVATSNQFDIATARGGDAGTKYVQIFGKSAQGVDEATAYGVIKEACLYTPDNLAENAPSAPVNGKIGISTDNVLGNRAKLRFRIYLREAFADGGIFQAALIARFSYTA
jgi:hypothetical protein